MQLHINPNCFHEEELRPAAEILRCGGLCAFPTETVYGLGANALDPSAVAKIFKAKGRPQDNPLIVHIADQADLSDICTVTPLAKRLMERFWGGPLTLILPKSKNVPYIVTAGLETVAVRLPSHPIANALIRLCGCPIAAPSANLSGKPSPTTGQDVIADLKGRVDVIIDGGNSFWGVESTVLDLTTEPPAVLRPGAVTIEELSAEIGTVIYGTGTDAPKSPGMKYKHYAPEAPLYVVEASDVSQTIREAAASYKNPAVLCPEAALSCFDVPICLSTGTDNAQYAARLFYCLREFDRRGADVIFAIPPTPGGIGDAVRNRLYKAAGGKIIF